MVSDRARAVRIFRDFTGREPASVDFVELPQHKTLVALGRVQTIGYRATRDDGVDALYVHKFRKSSRPVLAVSLDGSQLYLLAGAYRFESDRGIVDTGD